MYSKWKFVRTLDSLTKIYNSGERFGAHMKAPYCTLTDSVTKQGPIRLWRYDRFESKRLKTLEQGLVHLSTPESFNDPGDSMPFFDMEEIKKRIERNVTPEGVRHVHVKNVELGQINDLELQKRLLEVSLKNWEENKERLLRATDDELKDRYRAFRHEIQCACFSENPRNPTMWANYSDNWRGYVIGYDINPLDVHCHCTKSNCAGNMPFTLAPILYEKRYNMSPFSAVLMGACGFFKYPTFDIYLTLVHATIHKDERWSHEQEWRLFTGTCYHLKGDCYAEIAPAEIIVGSKASQSDISKMKAIADRFRIPLRQIIFDEDSLNYDFQILDLSR